MTGIWPHLGAALLLVLVVHRLAVWRYRLPARVDISDPPLRERPPGWLGRQFAPLVAAHPGLTGHYALDDARSAFAARLLLVRRAERSLDLQYYIWNRDTAGLLLLDEVRQAADRGVRVRLLLDDNGIPGLDDILAAFDAHPNIAVKLFNPFVVRRPKGIGYLLDFRRLNRRMHNKSLTADGAATILGGRNIGDEYLGASHRALFADLDVFAIGKVVAAVEADFERYWQSASVWPLVAILPPAPADGLARFIVEIAVLHAQPLAQAFAKLVGESVSERLVAGELVFEWARAELVSDDPAKGVGPLPEQALLGPRLIKAIGTPRHCLGLVSAYFVPTAAGVKVFASLAAAGASIQVMTNALSSNNVVFAHSGYAPSRKPLLRAGVRLWEMKAADGARRIKLRFRQQRRGQRGSILRSSGSALHAKTFTVDRERLFIGSFNFDPRSYRLNTEMGLLIESPVLAGRLQDMFDDDIARLAYEVRLDNDRLVWVESQDGGTIIHHKEPGTGPGQRLMVAVLAALPIKWML